MAEHGSSPQSRVIRVFLSSTFRDFMQERDLLVKQVFPELRRKARERGVEVVEVDLRWGITEEESHQGKVLPICLAEIQRCRPYFVGMLGERYGWVPPADDDNRVVLADEAWVEEHLGRRSVTELEILHGVLNNPEMAGRAFFYFRDPAWSQAQSEPGFVCDSTEEAEKLADLKQRILASGFPVVRECDLPNPKALADRIGEDLWALIEEQFPELDQPDALEREERKHASYRRSRTELYEDGGSGGGKVSQLAQWIAAGEQRILITGESGAGKSALIANWINAHQQSHPDDVVFAHHLGCSNDANALEPLLARMVQTASKLMADELSEPIKVPQDYWELVSTVTDTLSKLSFWCKQRDRRWIWVLDGLDRLPEENQQALPWLPLQLFPQLHVVISALDCPARTILQDREYTTLTIGPLERDEQKALIANYMRRYNKTLVPELEAKILEHEPARSPLFLRVVLDELRVCGRHETLTQQLDNYLKAQSVDALYAKVLERLEGDVGRDVVKKVMTALWASRAGLSESELLAVTKVKPLQWSPIDLGLEGSLGRNGERVVFDHDYLRRAVKERYLPTEEMQREEHSRIADYFESRDHWDVRDSEELPWQLIKADRIQELRDWLIDPTVLESLAGDLKSREVIDFWTAANHGCEQELDEATMEAVETEIERLREHKEELILFVDQMAELYEEAGLYREPLLRLRQLSVELEETSDGRSEELKLASLEELANTHCHLGDYDAAIKHYRRCLEASEQLRGREHPKTLQVITLLAVTLRRKGEYDEAETLYKLCLLERERRLGLEHPDTLALLNNLAVLYKSIGDHIRAEEKYLQAFEIESRLLGEKDPITLLCALNIGRLYFDLDEFEKAATYWEKAHEGLLAHYGETHPIALLASRQMVVLSMERGNLEESAAQCKTLLERSRKALGHEHVDTIKTLSILAWIHKRAGEYRLAQARNSEVLLLFEKTLGHEHRETFVALHNLAASFLESGDYTQAEGHYRRCMEFRQRVLGMEHPDTMTSRYDLARCLSALERYDEAIELRQIELAWCRKENGERDRGTLASINALADDLKVSGDPVAAEPLYRECLTGRIETLGDEHPDTMASRYALACCLSTLDRYDEAIALRRIELAWCEKENGPDDPDTLFSLHMLGVDLVDAKQPEAGLELLQDCLKRQQQLFGTTHERTLSTFARVLDALSDLERHAEAIALSESVQQALEADRCTKDPEVLNQISNQALLHERLEQLEVAERLWRRCLEGHERSLQSDDASMLRCIKRLARVLFQLDKSGEAESLYRRALSIQKDSLGLNHPEALSTAYALAEVLSQQQRHAEAIPLRRRELAWCRQINGDRDPGTLTSINGLAIDLRETGALEEAESLLQEAFAGRQQVLEPGSFEIGSTLEDLARTLELAGKLAEALAYSKQALEHWLANEGPDSWWCNRGRLDLARILHKMKRNQEAISVLQELILSEQRNQAPDEDDLGLILEAKEMQETIQASP